jgi:hypothetical protein
LFDRKLRPLMARRRSLYVSPYSLYRTSRTPGEYFFFSFVINLFIVACQLTWALVVFLISMIPSLVEIIISISTLCYHVLETFFKVAYEYLKPKILCIYEKIRVKYYQYKVGSSK